MFKQCNYFQVPALKCYYPVFTTMKLQYPLSLCFLLFVSCFACITAVAQSGRIDVSFNTGDTTPYLRYPVNAILPLPDGRMIIGSGNSSEGPVERYTATGILDSSFLSGSGFNWLVKTLARQPDGKILAGGQFSAYNGQACDNVARLHADGALDNSFNLWQGVKTMGVNCITVQTNGKILVGGSPRYPGTIALVRLHPDGSLDSSFRIGDKFITQVFVKINSIVQQPDGKILAAGCFGVADGAVRQHIVRLNADGTLDNSFRPAPGFAPETPGGVYALALQADGKIIAGGDFSSYNGVPVSNLVRLHMDGSLDTTFKPVLNARVFAVKIQRDGKIVAGGLFTKSIERFTTDGKVDTSFRTGNAFYFNTGGSFISQDVYALELEGNGSILAGGEYGEYNHSIRRNMVRIKPNGHLDSNFRIGGAADLTVEAVAFQKDNKILAGGQFRSYDGENYPYLLRLHPGGRIDSTFRPVLNSRVRAITVQPDGKILAGGSFNTCNSQYAPLLVRLNPDGSNDTTFRMGGGLRWALNPDYGVRVITLQPDGKILVGGVFIMYDGHPYNNIVRLNKNGSLDSTFKVGTGIDTDSRYFIYVDAISLQKDGKVLAGGRFGSYNGYPRNNFVRLNADGSIDNAFNISSVDISVGSHLLQPDGRIITLSWQRGAQTSNLTRCFADGSIDTSFHTSTFRNFIPRLQALQEDGRILYAAYTSVARLLTNGNVDESFYSEQDVPGFYKLGIQPDGRIMVVGDFYIYDGVVRNKLVRLLNCVSPVTPRTLKDATVDAPFDEAAYAAPPVPPMTLSFVAGRMPTGVSFDPATGRVSGVPQATGVYTFTIVAKGGSCVDTNTFTLRVDSANKKLLIFPNPVTDVIHIRFGHSPKGIYNLAMQDVWGRTLLQTTKNVTSSLDEMTIDIKHFASATYFLRIDHPELKTTVKMVKL